MKKIVLKLTVASMLLAGVVGVVSGKDPHSSDPGGGKPTDPTSSIKL
jgi:hypothetical protein